MTTWYVQTVAPITDGSDANWGRQYSSGDGSSGSPYGSIQELLANETLANGDIIELDTVTSGIPHYGAVTIAGIDSATLRRNPSVSGWQRMVCGYPVDLSTVHATGGTYDVYKTAAGGATSVPNRVSQNWNGDPHATKLHRYGIMTAQASAAACASTYGFFHDTGTDTLYVSIPSGADIADYEHIVGLAGHTLLINNCDDFTCGQGISAEHAFDESGTNGYGIRYDGDSLGGLVIGCQCDGTRWHGIGSVANDPTGHRIVNNICRSAIAGNDSQIVIYVGSTGTIAGCVISGNTIYLDRWIDPLGAYMGTGGVIGITSHTAATAADAPAGGLIIRNNQTIWLDTANTSYCRDMTFVAANAKLGGTPTDIADPATYGVQSYDNQWNGHGMQIGAGTGNEVWLASVRDRWYLDAENMSASTGSGGLISCNGGTSTDVGLLLVSCTISGDTVKTASHKSLVSVWTNGGKLYLDGCTLHMRGTGHNSGARILAFASSATGFSANGCVFSCEQASGMRFATGQWSGALPDTAAENAAFNYNWYDPKLLATFNSTTGDTRTTFESTTDPDGEYTAEPEYESDTTLEPTSGMQATTTTRPSGAIGINTNAFSDQYGAWQYGTSALPTIVNLTPADDGTGVADTQVLSIEFSHDVAFNVPGMLIEVYQGGAVVASALASSGTINGSNQTQYSLAALLTDLSGALSVHISPHAFKSLTDEIAFAGIEDDTTWNFAIASVTPVSAPARGRARRRTR